MAKKFVAYCRTSTENQREEKTIELQINSLEKYAREKEVEIVEWFKDDGVSGGLESRPELVRLLDYLKENDEVGSVLIYKLDRLARDLFIQEGLIRKFAELNKQVVSTLEPDLDSNDPFRKAFRQMLGVFSEFEKAMIGLRMKNGKHVAVSKGKWHGGFVYGYNNDGNGQLTINKSESEIVKKVFYMRNKQHKTYIKIADYLNTENIKTKLGGKWHASTIRAIIKNPIYKGKMRFGDKTYDGLHPHTF
ncbi:MAG: recombinase family protein [Candidatus Yanofskybacteria bacterium]|nr:recombinase family protein [Candidatus Yanofskybacteria bacterium]